MQRCPHCKMSPLRRVHKDGRVICMSCDEDLLMDADNSGNRYVVCGNCGFDENINPRHGDKCPRCGNEVL